MSDFKQIREETEKSVDVMINNLTAKIMPQLNALPNGKEKDFFNKTIEDLKKNKQMDVEKFTNDFKTIVNG